MASIEKLVAKRPMLSPLQAVVGGWLRRKVGEIRRERWAYVFVAPAVIIFLIFRVYPAFRALQFSFMRITPQAMSWTGLDNLRDLSQDAIFRDSIKVSFLYALGIVPSGLVIALLLSVLIFRAQDSLQSTFKASFYLPRVASAVVIALIWQWIYEPVFGLANYLIGLTGIEPQLWLSDRNLALPSLIVMELLTAQGPSIILLTAAMGSIPRELYESAHLDGAGVASEFFKITLPLLRPTLLYVIVTSTINAFKFFTPVYVMTKGGPYFATSSLVYYMYELAFNRYEFGKASAVSLILFIILLIVSLVYYRLLSTELEY
jgi:multiple sugar transport system permease protein